MQRIKKAYAENGDLKIIPETPPLDGSENWEQGRGAYFELDNDPNTGDPLALDIDREQDNYFKNVISKNIKHWQENTYPVWFDDIKYPKNATVKYTDGNIYVSKVANNTALPTNATNWTIYDPSSLDGQFVKLTGNQTIAGVKTFSSNIVGNITGNITGNSATATKLETVITIGGVSFDGSANINLPGVNTAGNQNTSGNSATATKLHTPININGVSFDGSANITVSDNTAVKLTGDETIAGVKTFSSNIVGNITGNAATATKLNTTRANYKAVTDSVVVGELMWKANGNGHTIFDASNSTSPTGEGVDNTNPDIAWSATYPTLMGYDGLNTYGVRVDSSRYAEYAATAEVGTNDTQIATTAFVLANGVNATKASTAIASFGVATLGSYVMASYNNAGINMSAGSTTSASYLRYANALGRSSVGTFSGTWRCMGIATSGTGSASITLWLRIA